MERNNAFILAIIGAFIGIAGLGQLYRGQIVSGLIVTIIGFILLISMFYTMGITLLAYVGMCIYCINDTRKELPNGV
jgi:TM2 domain-containing membrane protein YozV